MSDAKKHPRKKRVPRRIQRAAADGNYDVLRRLCRLHPECIDVADPHAKLTAMHNAACSGDEVSIKILHECRSGALDAQDVMNNTPMHLAAANGHFNAVMLLFDLGSKAFCMSNALSCYPFHQLIATKQFDVLQYFFRKQPDLIDAKDDFKKSFMYFAAFGNLHDLLLLLHRHGSEQYFEKGAGGWAPAQSCTYFSKRARRFYFSRSLTETLFFSFKDAVA